MSTRVALGAAAGIAVLLTLSGCSGNASSRALEPAPVAVTVTATPEPVEAPAEPVAEPAPVPSPTEAGPNPLDLTVTLYGTDAIFSWTTGGLNMHQTTGQTGPFSYTIPFDPTGYLDQVVNANVVSQSGDAGCKVTRGDFVMIDNTDPGQTFVSCIKTYSY